MKIKSPDTTQFIRDSMAIEGQPAPRDLSDRADKKPYTRPVLTRHGAVTRLTQAATGSLASMLRDELFG